MIQDMTSLLWTANKKPQPSIQMVPWTTPNPDFKVTPLFNA